VPSLSSFFLVLLGHYRLQLQHLSPHSTLVGDLRPLLRDVRRGVAIGVSVLVVPRAAPSEQAAASPRWLLLPALDQGS
jgi:hypothetical protein